VAITRPGTSILGRRSILSLRRRCTFEIGFHDLLPPELFAKQGRRRPRPSWNHCRLIRNKHIEAEIRPFATYAVVLVIYAVFTCYYRAVRLETKGLRRVHCLSLIDVGRDRPRDLLLFSYGNLLVILSDSNLSQRPRSFLANQMHKIFALNAARSPDDSLVQSTAHLISCSLIFPSQKPLGVTHARTPPRLCRRDVAILVSFW
jgi:hypothetical protein